jgi:uncharacterized protein YbcI
LKVDSIEDTLKDISSNIERVIRDREENLTNITDQRRKIHNEIQEERRKINEHLDKLEENVIGNLLVSLHTEPNISILFIAACFASGR